MGNLLRYSVFNIVHQSACTLTRYWSDNSRKNHCPPPYITSPITIDHRSSLLVRIQQPLCTGSGGRPLCRYLNCRHFGHCWQLLSLFRFVHRAAERICLGCVTCHWPVVESNILQEQFLVTLCGLCLAVTQAKTRGQWPHRTAAPRAMRYRHVVLHDLT